MLAQNFKTHTELDLDEKLYNALKKVLVRLETNDLVFIPDERCDGIDLDFTKPNGFSMNLVLIQEKCGTIGCIAGWAAIEMGVKPYVVTGMAGETNCILEGLFYPPSDINYKKIDTEQAATTLRDYLTTGEVDWSHVD